MLICRVAGSVIATRKHEKLRGCKLMIVEPMSGGDAFVAVDNIGAGVDERVLVVRGSGARLAYDSSEAMPIDAAIVGIIDEGTY